MSSLIANKVKTNMSLVSLSLYCPYYLMCHCSNLIIQQFICSLHTQLHTQLHTRLTGFLLQLVVCLVLPFYSSIQTVYERSWSYLCTHFCLCVCILVYSFFSHACCCWFTCNKFDVSVSVYLLTCVKRYSIIIICLRNNMYALLCIMLTTNAIW